jgi:CBS domain containing-hemolysin-like protein
VLDNLLLVIAALLLVLLNGFFVAAEFGLVKLRQTRIRSIAKSSGLRGKLLVTVHQHLDTYLSACQLGITLASLGLGWIGEPAFANLLQPLFHVLGVTSVEIIHGVSFFFAFSSFLSCILWWANWRRNRWQFVCQKKCLYGRLPLYMHSTG